LHVGSAARGQCAIEDRAPREDLRAQIAQMQAQMQQQQKQMQQMQPSCRTGSRGPAAGSEGRRCRTRADVTSATAYETRSPTSTSRRRRPPGVSEPLPEGYVRLGDTGQPAEDRCRRAARCDGRRQVHGYQDLFIPASIPVEGAPFYNSGSRTNLSAKQSVVRMDFRRDTPLGVMKVVYKNNFFGFNGEDMNYNLQYMYGELEEEAYSLLAGYFLSGFTDISVFPNTLDYEGPNSFTFKYTPQIRFTPVIYRGDSKLTLPMSLEEAQRRHRHLRRLRALLPLARRHPRPALGRRRTGTSSGPTCSATWRCRARTTIARARPPAMRRN
jgi:hypothetical protein